MKISLKILKNGALAVLLIALTAGQGLATGLGIDGTFARNGACGVSNGEYPDTDDWSLLTDAEFRSHERSCKFAWAHKEPDDTAWAVIFFCGIEGEYSSRLITVHQLDEHLFVYGLRDDDDVEHLRRCE